MYEPYIQALNQKMQSHDTRKKWETFSSLFNKSLTMSVPESFISGFKRFSDVTILNERIFKETWRYPKA